MSITLKKALGLFLALGIVSAAFAQQYAAKITVTGGNSFVVDKLSIKEGFLYRESEDSSTALSMIKEIEFRFSDFSLILCDSMFRTSERKALEELLDQYVQPVAQHSYLSTNLGDYLVWMLRTQYWNQNSSGMMKTIDYLRLTKEPIYTKYANMYLVMLLLDQGKISEAKTTFSGVENPEEISTPMAEYIRGQIALVEGESRQAMQHVARIVAFHSRDPEWMAPATILEARIYLRLGQPLKAQAVANELMIAYPDTQWSELGEQIKKEATES